jgi:hypothetical protein
LFFLSHKYSFDRDTVPLKSSGIVKSVDFSAEIKEMPILWWFIPQKIISEYIGSTPEYSLNTNKDNMRLRRKRQWTM